MTHREFEIPYKWFVNGPSPQGELKLDVVARV